MTKYTIIGNMTGNSMDAIDLVISRFDGDKICDIAHFTKPYDVYMQQRIDYLRENAFNKTRAQIEEIPEFDMICDTYIRQIAECINDMCRIYSIDKNKIDAIGFHGKTLDHNPPSRAVVTGIPPYSLQIGSGQMLADLTGINVVYDFRADYIMQGFEGAPLAGPHNAHIARTEGDGIYYNGGNTSNFALVKQGKVLISSDAGPFNEYTDAYIRLHTNQSFDIDGLIAQKGHVKQKVLQKLFDIGRSYYEKLPPKSGDPAYYRKDELFKFVADENISIEDAVCTFAYSAAYIAFHALSLLKEEIKLPKKIFLFGGGWKNPFVRQSFRKLFEKDGVILPEHQEVFCKFLQQFSKAPTIEQSRFGDYMEARLFADLARYRLENKVWEIPEISKAQKNIVCGIIAKPDKPRAKYSDKINRTPKGWQDEKV